MLNRLMSRFALFALIATAVSTAPAAAQMPPDEPAAASADIVVVDAEGEGLSKDEAIKAALRAALERGGKTEIFSESQVQNFELMRDTIIARADGIVTDFQITREQKGMGGTYKVWIRAKVSKSSLAESWGALQNVLNQIGRPRIMVAIAERIDGTTQDESTLASRIEERLIKSGFDVVARTGAAAIREKEIAAAAADGDGSKLQMLAREFDAHIYITGTTNANRAGIEPLYGAPVAFYNCDVQIKAYYTDSAKMLAAASVPNTRGGARGRREYSPQAAKMAVDNIAQPLIDELYRQVLREWSTAISAGGEITLEVTGLKFKDANQIKKLLADMDGVQQVNFSLTAGVATYRINAKLTAEQLAERLSDGEFGTLIEIRDLKLNRIQAGPAAP